MKGITTKRIAYLGMIALLLSLILGLIGFSNTTREVERMKEQLLKRHVENNIHLTMKYMRNAYGTLTQGKGTLLDENGESIEGRNFFVDSILEDLGDKSTIFVKEKDDFRRISTNIMFSAEERATSTYLGKTHNAYKTVMDGNLYIGEADILGVPYYTAYDPIKDVNDNVIGLLFVGTPTEELDNIVNLHDEQMDRINILIVVLRAISLGALILLVSASLIRPKTTQPEGEKQEPKAKQ